MTIRCRLERLLVDPIVSDDATAWGDFLYLVYLLTAIAIFPALFALFGKP